jgi:hypothetical protein
MLALIAWSKIGHRTEHHIAAGRLAASYNLLAALHESASRPTAVTFDKPSKRDPKTFGLASVDVACDPDKAIE